MQTIDTDTSNPNSARYKLGVLWVHGIGEQQPGETLTQFGTPVIAWLKHWLEPDQAKSVMGDVEVRSAQIRDPQSDSGAPAHASIRLRVWPTGGGMTTEQQWLFAEGHWGAQVHEPKLRTFLAWLVTRGPWMVLFHLQQCILQRPWFRRRTALGRLAHGLDRALAQASLGSQWKLLNTAIKGLVVLLLWNVLSLLLVALWLCVSLLALVPIGQLRSAVLSLMRRIARVVGDSYVLVADPLQRAALATAVISAMRWMRPQCERMMLVAHSQGAAVAHDALTADNAPRVESLATVGAGLVKLHALMYADQHFPQRFLFAGLVAPVLAASIAIGARLVQLEDAPNYLWLAAAILLIVGLVSVALVWESVTRTLHELKSNRWGTIDLKISQPLLRWRDFFGLRDPVPNGSMSGAIPVQGLRSVAVTVRGSMWADHTEYWNSRADFIPRLVVELARAAGWPMLGWVGASARLRSLRRSFRKRLAILSSVRWGDWLVALLPCIVVTDRVESIVRDVRGPLRELKFDALDKLLDGLDGTLAWIVKHALGVELANPSFWVNLSLSIAILFLLLSLWRGVFLAIWRWWSELDLDEVFTPSQPAVDGVMRFVVDQFVGLVAGLPLVLAIIWTWYPEFLNEVIAYSVFAIFGSGFLVLVLAMLSVRMLREMSAEWRSKARARDGGAIESIDQLINVTAVLVAVFAGIAELFVLGSLWTAGAIILLGVYLSYVVGAIWHYTIHVNAWRAGTTHLRRFERARLAMPFVVAAAACALFGVGWTWWLSVPSGLLAFALTAAGLRLGRDAVMRGDDPTPSQS